MKKTFGSALQVIGGISATIGSVTIFVMGWLIAGSESAAWLLLSIGAVAAVMFVVGLVLVHYGEKIEKQ